MSKFGTAEDMKLINESEMWEGVPGHEGFKTEMEAI
jgi:hypothetical protein